MYNNKSWSRKCKNINQWLFVSMSFMCVCVCVCVCVHFIGSLEKTENRYKVYVESIYSQGRHKNVNNTSNNCITCCSQTRSDQINQVEMPSDCGNLFPLFLHLRGTNSQKIEIA